MPYREGNWKFTFYIVKRRGWHKEHPFRLRRDGSPEIAEVRCLQIFKVENLQAPKKGFRYKS